MWRSSQKSHVWKLPSIWGGLGDWGQFPKKIRNGGLANMMCVQIWKLYLIQGKRAVFFNFTITPAHLNVIGVANIPFLCKSGNFIQFLAKKTLEEWTPTPTRWDGGFGRSANFIQFLSKPFWEVDPTPCHTKVGGLPICLFLCRSAYFMQSLEPHPYPMGQELKTWRFIYIWTFNIIPS